MKKEEIALNWYHGKENLNCAQSVLKSFQKEFALPDELILKAKKLGGGRSPDNKCGAIHAVEILLNKKNNEVLDKIFTQFKTESTSLKCKEIRKNKKINCQECVSLSAQLLAKELNNLFSPANV